MKTYLCKKFPIFDANTKHLNQALSTINPKAGDIPYKNTITHLLMTIDASFTQYIRAIIKNKLEIIDHYKVGELPLEIDLILKKSPNAGLTSIKNKGLGTFTRIFEDSGANTLVTEFKSRNDNVSEKFLYKLQGYHFFYIHKNFQEISNPNQDVTSILILTRPKKFIGKYIKKEIDTGIYQLDLEPVVYIIVINELALNVENYGLLMFATDDKLREYIRDILKSTDDKAELFKSYAFVYNIKEYKMVVEQENLELEEIDVATPIRIFGIKKAIDQLGLETVIDAVGIEAVINTVGIEAVINTVGIKALSKHLTDEQFDELMKLRKRK